MKRAVSSMDASAAQRGPTASNPGKLKRCKSAFANLKRLGCATAPTASFPADATCPEDATAASSSLPHWRRQSCVGSSSSACGGSGSGAGFPTQAAGQLFVFGSTWLTDGSSSPHSFVPIHESLSKQHPKRQQQQRMFKSSRRKSGGAEGEGEEDEVGEEEAEEHYNLFFPVVDACSSSSSSCSSSSSSGANTRTNSRRSSFSSTLNFSTVPEGLELEISSSPEGGDGGRCPLSQLQPQEHHYHLQQQNQDHEGDEAVRLAWTGGGPAVPASYGNGGGGGEYVRSCWADPGSPAFSIVGFGEESSLNNSLAGNDEEMGWCEVVQSTINNKMYPMYTNNNKAFSITSSNAGIFGADPVSMGSLQGAGVRGGRGGGERGCYGSGRSHRESFAVSSGSGGGIGAADRNVMGGQKTCTSLDRTMSGSAAAAPAITIATCTGGKADHSRQKSTAAGPTTETPMLLHIQRRFEEMLLVSNVAT